MWLLFAGWALSAQEYELTGRVFDNRTNEPLPFVNITYNQTKNGTAADIDGRFLLNAVVPITHLTFSFVGYEKIEMPIPEQTPKPLKIYMREVTTTLREVTVVAGENPAHRIVRNASRNRSINNPTNLNSFSYESYNKLVFSLEGDSAVMNSTNEDDRELANFMERQHLFLMESVSERQYMKPGKDNERITANRVSGFKNPTFALLASQFQSFSFYDDFITVLDKNYLNPISTGSTSKYVFIIQDSTFQGSDTTYVISFTPKKNHKFDALQGLLYISTNGWAVQNVIAEPVNQEGLYMKIQQMYELFPGGSWFPIQLNFDFKMTTVELNSITPLGIGRTYLKNIVINPELEKKEFSRIDLKVDDDANSKADDYWLNYRVDSLTEKEKTTYLVIDSLGEEHKFEQKLKWLTALTEGKIRVGYFDLPLQHWLRFNIYEGLRLGFGAETSPKLLQWFKVGGYAGYGFSDRVWKYGYYTEVRLNNEQNLKIGGGYRFDIFESGGDMWIEDRTGPLLDNTKTRFLWIQQFDEVSDAFAYLTWHPLPNLHTKLQMSRQNRYMVGRYQYLTTNAEGSPILQNGFTASLVQVYVQYSPNDKYMEGPFGRRPIKRTFPLYTAQYTRGLPDVLGSEFDFHRLDIKLRHDVLTKELGVSSLEIRAGQVWGDVPYSYLYNGRGNSPTESFTQWPIFLADQFSFESMFNNEFLNSRYVQVMFRQNFEGRIFKIKSFAPQIEWMIRGLWGNLSNPERHQGIEFTTAMMGFYETGIEINRLMGSTGVGFYYRFGPNMRPELNENFSIKLTTRLALLQ